MVRRLNVEEIRRTVMAALDHADEAIIDIALYDDAGNVVDNTVAYVVAEKDGRIIATTLSGKKYDIGRRDKVDL